MSKQWASDLADKYESGEIGWTQGYYGVRHPRTRYESYCLMGGCAYMASGIFDTWGVRTDGHTVLIPLEVQRWMDVWDPFNKYVVKVTGSFSTTLNDTSTTTVEDIIALLRGYAAEG